MRLQIILMAGSIKPKIESACSYSIKYFGSYFKTWNVFRSVSLQIDCMKFRRKRNWFKNHHDEEITNYIDKPIKYYQYKIHTLMLITDIQWKSFEHPVLNVKFKVSWQEKLNNTDKCLGNPN